MTKYPPIKKIECSEEFYIPTAKCKFKLLRKDYCENCCYFIDCKEEEFKIKSTIRLLTKKKEIQNEKEFYNTA